METINFDFFGNAFLTCSLLGAFYTLISSFRDNSTKSYKNTSFVIFFGLFSACCYLSYQFVTDNFSYLYVASNSNLLLPTFYKVSALWSAHEGSFLLMIMLLALANYINNLVLVPSRNLVISNQVVSSILVLYLIFLITSSNPFYLLNPAPLNGADLNPLLQDPLLVIHPPLIFTGYVFYAVTFSFVLSALINGFTKDIFNTLKIWAGVSWFTLTMGIFLGSIWAYYELGWGGYWFWDPVENVSLMPWIAGTAFTHSLIFSREKTLEIWMVFLGIITFLLSIFGSFVVRSGILNSVHTFAADPTRGIFLLGIFAIFSVLSFYIFFTRSNLVKTSWPKFMSKNYLVLLNNIILMSILFIVLIGTLYPIILEAFTSNKLSIGPSYFSNLISPLVIALLLIFTMEQFLKQGFRKLIVFAALIIILSLIVQQFILKDVYAYLVISGIILLALMARAFFELLKTKSIKMPHKILGHISVVILTFAVIFNHNFSQNLDLRISPGENISAIGTNLKFDSIDVIAESNFDGVKALFLVDDVFDLAPEKRIYKVGGQITSETSIESTLFHDYLIVLGDRFPDGSWSISFSRKSGMIWIWVSSFLLMISIFYGTIRRI